MDEPSSPDRPGVAEKRQPCMNCGYDLRGSDNSLCPECGMPTAVPLRVQGKEQYLNIKAALEHAKLLMRSRDPGGSLGSYAQLIGGGSDFGVVWVPSTELDAVEAIFDSLDVPMPLAALPIVDRSETQCPQCGAPLDSNGPASCGQCGFRFQWIDIQEPDHAPKGMTCVCGYDLQGLTSERCPECGALLPNDLDQLVAMASALPTQTAQTDRVRAPVTRRSMFIPIAVILTILGLYVWGSNAPAGVVMLVTAICLLIVGTRSPSSTPREHAQTHQESTVKK